MSADTDKLIAQARAWRHDLMPHTVELLNALADELEQSQAETLDARVQTAWKVAEVREQLEAAGAALKDARDDGVVSAERLGLEVAAEYQRANAAEADLAQAREAIAQARRDLWWFIERSTSEDEWGFSDTDVTEIAARAMAIQDDVLGAALAAGSVDGS
jgi:hypothetical protein